MPWSIRTSGCTLGRKKSSGGLGATLTQTRNWRANLKRMSFNTCCYVTNNEEDTMKHRLLYVFGLVVLGSLWLAAGPAAADAVGPYYAAPSWDQTLAASTRFIVLSNMNGDAVLDRETG